MRYREGAESLPLLSESASTDGMLLFTVLLSLVIGFILTALGVRGRQIWLTVWSAGLILASIAYLVWRFALR